MSPDDPLLEVSVVAKRLKRCPETIRRYIRAGMLRGERVHGSGPGFSPFGGRWLVRQSAIADLFATGMGNVRLDREGDVDRCGVYFVAGAGLVKIGSAVNILARFGSIAGASPVTVELIGWIPVRSSRRTDVESEAHEHFKAHRIRGEWFRLKRAIVEAYISGKKGQLGRPVLKNLPRLQQVATPDQ